MRITKFFEFILESTKFGKVFKDSDFIDKITVGELINQVKSGEIVTKTKNSLYKILKIGKLSCATCKKPAYFAGLYKSTGNTNIWGLFTKDNRQMTIDHIYPVVDGGENKYSNYQILCEECNVRKSYRIYYLYTCVGKDVLRTWINENIFTFKRNTIFTDDLNKVNSINDQYVDSKNYYIIRVIKNVNKYKEIGDGLYAPINSQIHLRDIEFKYNDEWINLERKNK
jgi:5-methylcytosine-specific restriction endonuclease McrA